VEWDDRQLRSVLLHELAHVKRCDVAAQWLIQIAVALHWFNPLVWIAAWRLHAEGERACDNLVLASGVRASEYAEHLLHVATKLSPACWVPACSLAMARPSRLEGRLNAVLNERLNRRGVTRALALAALAVGLCVTIPVAMLRAAADRRMDTPTGNSSVAGAKLDVEAPSPADDVTVEIANNGSLSFAGKAVTLEALTNELALLERANPNLKIVVLGQRDVAIANLVKLIDALKQATVASVSLVTERPEPTAVSRVGLQQAENELQRASELRRQKLISEAEYEKARYDVELRRAELSGNKTEIIRARLGRAEA